MNIRSPGRGLSNKILKIYDTVLPEFFPESKNFYGELTNYLCFAEEFNTGGRKGISIELAKLLSTIHEFPKKEETPYIYISPSSSSSVHQRRRRVTGSKCRPRNFSTSRAN